ncbi:arylesterase [Kiloniella sp. b19]|uniref:arylesterase n=1 Tax=Kiloniella sp. GXU_MW_B19 TaxID=3141326 RepID=UPI0031DAFF48
MPFFPSLKLSRTLLSLLAALLVVAGVTSSGAQAQEKPFRIMAFGDSLVHGYGLPAGQSFPDQLEQVLLEQGYNISMINAGNSGDTTAAGLARVDWALGDNPDVAIIVLGGNDSLRGLNPEQTRSNIEAIIDRFQAADVKVLLAGMMAPRNLGTEYVSVFDSLYPELAQSKGTAFYPFFLEGVAQVPELNQADGIHPNRAGVEKITERLLPSLLPLIPSEYKSAS